MERGGRTQKIVESREMMRECAMKGRGQWGGKGEAMGRQWGGNREAVGGAM